MTLIRCLGRNLRLHGARSRRLACIINYICFCWRFAANRLNFDVATLETYTLVVFLTPGVGKGNGFPIVTLCSRSLIVTPRLFLNLRTRRVALERRPARGVDLFHTFAHRRRKHVYRNRNTSASYAPKRHSLHHLVSSDHLTRCLDIEEDVG